ncbi:MAG: hypothetical protein Q8Q20_04445 [bacterium]|nr:hypothetical protein [bacterium]
MPARSVAWGSVAATVLFGLFAGIVRLAEGNWQAVRIQLEDNGAFIVLLALGFGVQLGLWYYLKTVRKSQSGKYNRLASGAGASSTTSMLACCSHYLVNVFPWLGLASVSAQFMQYQREILLIGISINLLGIAYMLRHVSHYHQSIKACPKIESA